MPHAQLGPVSSSLRFDDRGTATVEYVIVLVTVSVLSALALMALGAPLLSMFRAGRLWLLLPLP